MELSRIFCSFIFLSCLVFDISWFIWMSNTCKGVDNSSVTYCIDRLINLSMSSKQHFLWYLIVSGSCYHCSCSNSCTSLRRMITWPSHPTLGVFDTLSDSIQCLNFAKKWFIQYSIQYCSKIQFKGLFKINFFRNIQIKNLGNFWAIFLFD